MSEVFDNFGHAVPVICKYVRSLSFGHLCMDLCIDQSTLYKSYVPWPPYLGGKPTVAFVVKRSVTLSFDHKIRSFSVVYFDCPRMGQHTHQMNRLNLKRFYHMTSKYLVQ